MAATRLRSGMISSATISWAPPTGSKNSQASIRANHWVTISGAAKFAAPRSKIWKTSDMAWMASVRAVLIQSTSNCSVSIWPSRDSGSIWVRLKQSSRVRIYVGASALSRAVSGFAAFSSIPKASRTTALRKGSSSLLVADERECSRKARSASTAPRNDRRSER